jgi:predicted transcriptional regulator
MEYRSRTEIVSQILEAANNGISNTKMMYRAFLSYSQLKKYLKVLAVNGLLDFQQVDELYRTAEKARNS